MPSDQGRAKALILLHAQAAGLRRLSTRAATTLTPATPRHGSSSFTHLARTVIAALRACGVPVGSGLSDTELIRIEAVLGFAFPPDLRAILQEGTPAGPGFPDWQSGEPQSRVRFNLPAAGLSCEVGRGRFWARQWGRRPPDPEQAVRLARSALTKAPLLIPLYSHYYLPCNPNLAGNPVFFIERGRVLLASCDLEDFFLVSQPFATKNGNGQIKLQMETTKLDALISSSQLKDKDEENEEDDEKEEHLICIENTIPKTMVEPNGTCIGFTKEPSGRTPRHIDFWGDIAAEKGGEGEIMEPLPCDPDRSTPLWVQSFLEELMAMLRQGGWSDKEVSEAISLSPPRFKEQSCLYFDRQSVMEELVLHINMWSDTLSRAGWSSNDLAEAFDVDISLLGQEKRPTKMIPAGVAARLGRLAQFVRES